MALSRGSSLEVVSEENFRARRDGINASNDKCIDCIKERGGPVVGKDKKSRKRRKKEKVVRVNSPIVVRLRDTIRVSSRDQKTICPKTSDTDSASSTDTDDNVELKMQNSRNETLHSKAIRGSMRLKGEKNFMAFLNAVKKVHCKEHDRTPLKKSGNLYSENEVVNSSASVASRSTLCSGSITPPPLLNNLRDYHQANHCSTTTTSAVNQLRSAIHKAPIQASTDNVKVVRNDLHSTSTLPKQDSLDSETGSLSPSPSPSSDTDIEESSSSSVESEELSRYELQYLSSYTTGAPLTRYDCTTTPQRRESESDFAPQDCPQCMAAYNAAYRAAYNTDCVPVPTSSILLSDDVTVTSVTTPASAVTVVTDSYTSDSELHEGKRHSVSSRSSLSSDSSSSSSSSNKSDDSRASEAPYQVHVLDNGQVEVSLRSMYEKAETASPSQRTDQHSKRQQQHFRNKQQNRRGRNRQNHKNDYYTGAPFYQMNYENNFYTSSYHHQNFGSNFNTHHNHNAYNHHQPYNGYSHNSSVSPWMPPPPYSSSVFIDLTNSDVTLEIDYHSSEISNGSPRQSKNSNKYGGRSNKNNRTDSYNGRHSPFEVEFDMDVWGGGYNPQMTVGFFPYALPYYLTPPYYYMCPLMMSIPRPICVPRDTPCLSSQRMCLVPAHQAKTFTSSQPNPRPWLPLASPEINRPVAIYTVMCYNVLCDMYCTRQLYGYCPSWALSWEYRKKAIIEEIRQYSADLITLQEVETEQFDKFFLPELKRDGYSGIFSPKSRAKTMNESDKRRVDGCAIFFKANKFTLVKEHLIEFNQLAMSNAEGSHDMINRVMTKDNIGLCAVLETKDSVWEHGLPANASSRQTFMVATCHIHWDPEFSDVKLIQTMLFINELKKIADENKPLLRPGGSGSNSNIPIMLCGDLNSLPESGVVEFLNASRVSCKHGDFREKVYTDCLRKIDLDQAKQTFTHDFKLSSAYDPSVMPFTNYTFDFKGIIDYIFYSRDSMRPLGVLGPLDPEWFRSNKVLGCPHPHIPSDHLPLLVEIEMTPMLNSNQSLSTSAASSVASTATSGLGAGGAGVMSGSSGRSSSGMMNSLGNSPSTSQSYMQGSSNTRSMRR